MTVFAIELNDRAVSLARGGEVLTSAPSAVFNGTGTSPAGANAWRELRSQPMATSSRHLGAVLTQRNSSMRAEMLVAAELQARLAEQPIRDGERIWIATPAQAEATGLEALLGIVRRLGLHIDGFIDWASVATAALGSERNTIVLELGLHHAAATAVDCEGSRARRRRSVWTGRGGFIELYQVWLDLITTTMVKRTRFDPLHDAATEQQLFDAVPSLAQEVASTGNTAAIVTKGQERFEVALTRDQFAQAAEPIYRAIVGLLHQLRPAGAPLTIVVPAPVAELPGIAEQLEQFVGCELVSVPDGFVAAAASLLELPEPERATGPEPTAGANSVRLLRRLPLQALAVLTDSLARRPLGQRRSGGPAPSHALLNGRAYSLSAESLVVGRAPETQSAPSTAVASGTAAVPASSRYITLPEGLAGVSRRHCTFVHDGDELILLDHSTFGTFVNGERVQERVRVHAGDRVRLGEPGVELALIAVGEVAATTQQP
jgi:FHA domain